MVLTQVLALALALALALPLALVLALALALSLALARSLALALAMPLPCPKRSRFLEKGLRDKTFGVETLEPKANSAQTTFTVNVNANVNIKINVNALDVFQIKPAAAPPAGSTARPQHRLPAAPPARSGGLSSLYKGNVPPDPWHVNSPFQVVLVPLGSPATMK